MFTTHPQWVFPFFLTHCMYDTRRNASRFPVTHVSSGTHCAPSSTRFEKLPAGLSIFAPHIAPRRISPTMKCIPQNQRILNENCSLFPFFVACIRLIDGLCLLHASSILITLSTASSREAVLDTVYHLW